MPKQKSDDLGFQAGRFRLSCQVILKESDKMAGMNGGNRTEDEIQAFNRASSSTALHILCIF